MTEPILALDIGGSKILAALVGGAEVVAEARAATDPAAGPDAWLEAVRSLVAPWRGRYALAGAAVTGLVSDGLWSALNPAVLPIPPGFPLEDRLARLLGVPARAWNDAQAAAWGEHRWGAGQGVADLAFVTLSTGIGGGIVLGGRLVTGRGGLAGHFGIAGPVLSDEPPHLEEGIAGRWIAAEAARAGHPVDAAEAFAAADRGEAWAEAVRDEHTARAARLLANIQLALAPDLIVVGGGLGLAPGQIDRLRDRLAPLPDPLRPRLALARLGPGAGVVGAADLARSETDHATGRMFA